jgi:hypothetical protein
LNVLVKTSFSKIVSSHRDFPLFIELLKSLPTAENPSLMLNDHTIYAKKVMGKVYPQASL